MWQAIFLLSPDTEFSSSGLGKKSNISYKSLFYNYKKVLVSKWTTKRIISIVTNINRYVFKAAKGPALDPAQQESHTDAINRALAALDMDSDSDDKSDASAFVSTALSATDPEPSKSAALALSTIDARSVNSQPEGSEPDIMHDALVADVDARVPEAIIQDAGGSVSGRGRAKPNRGSRKKAAAPQAAATSCATRSRK